MDAAPAIQSPSKPAERLDISPPREEVHRLFQGGDLVPVYRKLLVDLETPMSVYLKLSAAGKYSFLLESVEGGEQVGRYSFLGINPKGVITVKDRIVRRTYHGETQQFRLPDGQDPLHIIEREFKRVTPVHLDGLPRLVGGAVGYLSYDIVRHFEKLPDTAADELDMPDVAFMLPDTLVIFDHAKQQLIVMANAHNLGDMDAAYDDAVERIDQIVAMLRQPLPEIPTGPLTSETPVASVTQEEFEDQVRRAKEYIAAGDAFQIVLSQRFTRKTQAEPIAIYRALRATNPSPYMFFLNFGDEFTLMGASPEMLTRYENGLAHTRPLAGTRRRGQTEAQDRKLADELLADPKERAEHVMLVDLGRNDLGRVSEYGTVKVTEMMVVERYSHVMHIVSHVQGKLRRGMNAFDLVRATFPAGTLSGAPKVRAMEIIEELEGLRRGPYGGAVGYFSFDGSMDMCITIRSILMKGDKAYLQVGAGVVADSDPTLEYEETINKGRAVAAAIDYAEKGLI
jgi:anthranilate synthase component 1